MSGDTLIPAKSFPRVFVRVPPSDWAAVKHGVKREFRRANINYTARKVEKPTPVIAFDAGHKRTFDPRLMVLESIHREPLGAITPEGLAAEGVDTLAEFKVRWTANIAKRFDPLKKVWVVRMRPWEPSDDEFFKQHIFDLLFPEELRGL